MHENARAPANVVCHQQPGPLGSGSTKFGAIRQFFSKARAAAGRAPTDRLVRSAASPPSRVLPDGLRWTAAPGCPASSLAGRPAGQPARGKRCQRVSQRPLTDAPRGSQARGTLQAPRTSSCPARPRAPAGGRTRLQGRSCSHLASPAATPTQRGAAARSLPGAQADCFRRERKLNSFQITCCIGSALLPEQVSWELDLPSSEYRDKDGSSVKTCSIVMTGNPALDDIIQPLTQTNSEGEEETVNGKRQRAWTQSHLRTEARNVSGAYRPAETSNGKSHYPEGKSVHALRTGHVRTCLQARKRALTRTPTARHPDLGPPASRTVRK
uniref:Uncharacterized protein LOC105078047 n=1 Tax=Camelus bactrianus TaxID=9837 RepID=A0A9W3H6D7_CAMBA|nr:uncharacterized protein LOC105078047 [Camelus bactrianus]